MTSRYLTAMLCRLLPRPTCCWLVISLVLGQSIEQLALLRRPPPLPVVPPLLAPLPAQRALLHWEHHPEPAATVCEEALSAHAAMLGPGYVQALALRQLLDQNTSQHLNVEKGCVDRSWGIPVGQRASVPLGHGVFDRRLRRRHDILRC